MNNFGTKVPQHVMHRTTTVVGVEMIEDHVYTCPLARNVLAVAVWRPDGWRCYIGAVVGADFNDERNHVAARGTKQPESLAGAIFPHFSHLPYAA